MHDGQDIDPGLFGLWPKEAGYDGFRDRGGERALAFAPEIRRIVLETKSGAEPEPDLHALLNDLTREMADQFRAFRALRAGAETLITGSEDEAAVKLAKADIKAATDAISLIVRTLEKLDSLQRTLANDRALEAERTLDAHGFAEARQKLVALVDARAEERAHHLFERWKSEAAAEAARPPPGDGCVAAPSAPQE